MATKPKFKPYICAECREPCEEIAVDFGIGSYEYWGQRGCDRDVRVVSDCCEGELLDPDTLSEADVSMEEEDPPEREPDEGPYIRQEIHHAPHHS